VETGLVIPSASCRDGKPIYQRRRWAASTSRKRTPGSEEALATVSATAMKVVVEYTVPVICLVDLDTREIDKVIRPR